MRKILAVLLSLTSSVALAQNVNGGGGGGGGGGSVTQGTTPWTDQGTGAAGAAVSGNPFRAGISDGTNTQNWLSALALGDGVNGNNTGAVAGWVWNGATWDRMPGSTAGVKTATQAVVPTATVMQSAATGSGNGTPLSVAGYGTGFINVVCSVACGGGTTINFEATDSTGTFFPILGTPIAGGAAATTAIGGGQWVFNVTGLTSLRARISAYSTGTITATGAATVLSGNASNDTVALGNLIAASAYPLTGYQTYSLLVLNNTTGISVKGSPGILFSAEAYAIGGAPVWAKIYDTASAPTCGSGTPVKRLIVPVASTAANGAGNNAKFGAYGFNLANGIGLCVTGGIADNDTTAPVSNSYIVNLTFR